MTKASRLQVYWDGECPFCGALAARLHQFDSRQAIELLDYHLPSISESASPRFRYDDLSQEMHVKMPNDTWRIGYWAWAAILQELPLFGWLGHFMMLPIFAEIGPNAYRFIAKHRLEISKILGLPEPCDISGSCRIPAK